MLQAARKICDFALCHKSLRFSFSPVAADGHMRIVGYCLYLFDGLFRTKVSLMASLLF